MAANKKLSREEAEEYTKNIGSIHVGNYGLMEMARDILKVPEALDLTFDEWVTDRLGGFVRLSLRQRRDAVRELSGERSESGRYERSAAEVAGLLGLSAVTVERDREVLLHLEETKVAQKELESPLEEEKPKLSPVEKKAAIRRLIGKGKSNAEIAVELDVGVSTVGKERAEVNKEKAAPKERELKDRLTKLREKASAGEVMSEEEAEALIGDTADRMKKALADSTYGEVLSVELEGVVGTLKYLMDTDAEITDFDRALGLWGQIGNDLWVYGAKRGLDVSSIAEALDRMRGGE
jgi:transposase